MALPILRSRPCLVMGMPVARAIFCLELFFYTERARALGEVLSAVNGYSVIVLITNSMARRVRVITLAMSGDIDLFNLNDGFSRFLRFIVRYAKEATTSKDKCA